MYEYKRKLRNHIINQTKFGFYYEYISRREMYEYKSNLQNHIITQTKFGFYYEYISRREMYEYKSNLQNHIITIKLCLVLSAGIFLLENV